MNFNIPSNYTHPWKKWDFLDFDREYEKEHMLELIQSWWPVNWNHVHKDNICLVWIALVHRILYVDVSKILKKSRTIIKQTSFNITWLLQVKVSQWNEIEEISPHES